MDNKIYIRYQVYTAEGEPIFHPYTTLESAEYMASLRSGAYVLEVELELGELYERS